MKALADFLSYSTRSGCSASSLYAEATAKVLAVLRDCERVKSEPLDTQSTSASQPHLSIYTCLETGTAGVAVPSEMSALSLSPSPSPSPSSSLTQSQSQSQSRTETPLQECSSSGSGVVPAGGGVAVATDSNGEVAVDYDQVNDNTIFAFLSLHSSLIDDVFAVS